MVLPMFDKSDFRRALGSFVTGVTIVTSTDDDGNPIGFTANSFTSVSLDPPLVLVCIGLQSSNIDSFRTAKAFAVNILSEEQKNAASIFATRGVDRFASVPWHKSTMGVPVLDGAASWFECDTYDRIVAGDHLILIGKVGSYGHEPVTPLGFCRGNYLSFQLDQDIISSRTRKTNVGIILETREGIVLLRNESGRFRLPVSPKLGSKSDTDSLQEQLKRLGLDVEIDFLYAVYENENDNSLNVYYRGTAEPAEGQPADYCVFALDALPWNEVATKEMRVLLQRYISERANARFSIYAGNAESGRYQAVAGSSQSSD